MGYIRRLEVKGFKSFGSKILTITFEQGLTVVTGPNGSGKSNIADAILFSLGENSPRILRAAQGRLSGLIYDPKKERDEEGGSYGEERPTSCRATIQLDNLDRKIPVDSDSVTLSRELRNNGENVYFLNGKKTTKSIIADLLDVSGLSPSGLNVVPQGAATRVADQTPDEKRKMIEEVVGISKFDDKKTEAQKQLAQADTKLQIELARTGEMKGQLERLEVQRNDLVRYTQLESQVTWLKAVQTSRKVNELREKLNSTKKQQEEMLRKLDEVGKRKEEFEAKIVAVSQEKDKFILEIVQGGGEGPTHLRDDRESAKFKVDSLSSELQKREESMRRLEAEAIPNLRVALGERRKQITASTSTVEAFAATEEKFDARRKEVAAQLELVRSAEDTVRGTLDRKRKQTDKIHEKLAELGQDFSPLDMEVNSVVANLNVERKRLEELDGKMQNFGRLMENLDSDTTRCSSCRPRRRKSWERSTRASRRWRGRGPSWTRA